MPEETNRIVKAQVHYTDGAALNLYSRPIEDLQAILDLEAVILVGTASATCCSVDRSIALQGIVVFGTAQITA